MDHDTQHTDRDMSKQRINPFCSLKLLQKGFGTIWQGRCTSLAHLPAREISTVPSRGPTDAAQALPAPRVTMYTFPWASTSRGSSAPPPSTEFMVALVANGE